MTIKDSGFPTWKEVPHLSFGLIFQNPSLCETGGIQNATESKQLLKSDPVLNPGYTQCLSQVVLALQTPISSS